MSTRDKLFTMLDTLSDEQLEGLYSFLKNFISLDESPNADTSEAMAEVERMRQNPDDYKSYNSVEEMMEDILNEV